MDDTQPEQLLRDLEAADPAEAPAAADALADALEAVLDPQGAERDGAS
jgi:hypothetical protein